jgi:hypothetical protein
MAIRRGGVRRRAEPYRFRPLVSGRRWWPQVAQSKRVYNARTETAAEQEGTASTSMITDFDRSDGRLETCVTSAGPQR